MIQSFAEWTPDFGPNAWVHPAATVIGNVHLGANCSVWPGAVIRGDVNAITIGARSNVQDGSVFHVESPSPQHLNGFPLIVGCDVTVGHGVILHGCTIGDRCLIGMGAIIMDGVVVEEEVLIAAGALVPQGKHLPSGWLYRGQPAIAVRELTQEERAFFRLSADHYVDLKNRYL